MDFDSDFFEFCFSAFLSVQQRHYFLHHSAFSSYGFSCFFQVQSCGDQIVNEQNTVSGDRVLLIDDLITTGLNLKKAAEAIRAEGGVVQEVVALLDREEGGKAKLEKIGIKIHTLLQMSEVAETLYEIGAIDEESLKTIQKQIKNNGR